MPDLPTSARLTYAEMDLDDLDDVARLLGDERVMRFYPRTRTRDESAKWIRRQQQGYAADGFGLWLLRDPAGTFVGECGLTWQSPGGVRDLELGYHLLPEHQGLGYATEAATACRELARRRGVPRLIAVTVPGNRPSQRVAERVGLTHERSTTMASGQPVEVHSLELAAPSATPPGTPPGT